MRSIFISFFLSINFLLSAQSFYDINTIQDIRIYFGFSDWDYRMDTAYAGAGEYIPADSVVVNGALLPNCGVRYKGNSSYDVSRAKNPLHIKLDEYTEDQNYEGYEDIKLGNGYSDNSMLREPLSYKILRQYMDAPLSNFAKVYINSAYYGIMNNTESIDSRFLRENYYSSNHTFFKCNPPGSPGLGNGSNLSYNGTDVLNYNTVYELKSDTGWSELFQLCDTLNNHFSEFNSIADVDRFLWMLAYNNALVNLDSYTGTFRQNFYLYRNHAGQWIPTIWDLNMCFGSFSVAGGITGSLTPSSMQTMSYTLHKTENGWPLISQLLNDAFYSKMYYAHLRTINAENFANAAYKIDADSMHTWIDAVVQSDTNYLGLYTDFQNSLTTNTTITITGGQCPGIYPLMDGRASYLSNVLSAAPPVISNINEGISTTYGTATNITAQITNSTAVYLGYRYAKQDRFVRVQMFDDGAHGDGAASDNVFGALLPLNSLNVQYYIYAENANTGTFSPERAEHEFYSIAPTITNATSQQIVLNEITANNSWGIENENGKFKDWIEIYNTTNQTLGLSGWYLTDSISELTKWNFPDKSLIQPNEHLLVWADDLDKTFLDLHTNFNLSETGETVFLTDGANILDSVSFGVQSTDAALGRCADGVGNFTTIANRTPRAVNNCNVGISELPQVKIFLFPNPASEMVYVNLETDSKINSAEVKNIFGQTVLRIPVSGSSFNFSVENISSGIYFLQCGNAVKKFVVEQ